MIKIIYLISFLLLFVTMTLIKKKDEKIDFLTSFFIQIIVISCYNIIIYFILKLFNLSSNLIIYTIINFLISILLLFLLIKIKQIQKYYIKIEDIFAIIIISIVGNIILIINFGLPLNISYVSIDAATHYGMTKEFYQTGNISLDYMPGAAINYGLMFKVFYNNDSSFSGYKIFVVCEILKLIFSGVLFYLTIKQFSKKDFTYFIGIILAIIYMIAYPLNGILTGFVYFQMAINIISAIIIIVSKSNGLNRKIYNITLFTFCFGLIFTYFILVIPVYIALIINELKEIKKDKKKIIMTFIVILIPCIAAIIYWIFLGIVNFKNNADQLMSKLSAEEAKDGYIFVNYFSMFLFFLPFNIHYVYKNIKNKKNDIFSITFITNIIYIIILLILQFNQKIVRYYVMKPYYLLWLIMLLITGKEIFEILNYESKKIYKILVSTLLAIYLFGLIYAIFIKGACSYKIFEKETEDINSMYNIYRVNRGLIMHETFSIIYTNGELEILNDTINQIEDNSKIYYIENLLNAEWVNKIFIYKNRNISNIYYLTKNKEQRNNIKQEILNTDEKIYVICYPDYFMYKYFSEEIELLNQNLNIISKQERFTIYTN